MFRSVCLGMAIGLGLAFTLPTDPASAFDKTRRYGLSSAPWWQVGELNRELSLLCQRNEFNQIQKDALYIAYVGEDNRGRTLTGIAKQNWNLYDPRRRSEAIYTYHFRNDGYSNCQVYQATNEELRALGAGGAQQQ